MNKQKWAKAFSNFGKASTAVFMKRFVTDIFVLLIIFGFFSCQGEIIYHPDRKLIASPLDIRLEYDEVLFRAADGTTLHGWFIPHPESRATVIHCHGNAGNISHRLQIIHTLHNLQLDVFIFDYRGYGKSEGTPSEKGTYLDAEGAWDYLVNTMGISPQRIIVHGHSLGGAIATYLAHKRPTKMLIVESAFTSTRALARDYCVGFVLLSPILTYKYPTKEFLSRINIPVLIVHSRDDEIIPFAHGKELYTTARQPKEFLEIYGDHNTGFLQSFEIYRKGIYEFISKYLKEN
ncbi:MAG: alpha/beta hydrolase [Spirochaetes bacterium]|nr:alpha/beta hydrolase [Spirochaetota bacterium]